MNETTLEEAKQQLRDHWKKGVNCSCCGQFVKLYKRSLNSGMAYGLINIYRIDQTLLGDRYFEVAKEFTKNGLVGIALEYPKLAYWGLLETISNDKKDANRRSGFWRITDKGKMFVEGRISVPKYIYLYNTKLVKTSEEKTTIKTALGTRFDYLELMGDYL